MRRRTSPPTALSADEARSLADLYRRYSGWLRRVLSRRFGDAEVEDLVQETYLRLAPHQSDLKIRHPQALLIHVATNAGRDGQRRRRARGGTALALGDLPATNMPFTRPDQVEALVLKQLILGLPEPLREVFVLSRFAGASYEQIAEHFGISVKTVEWRMSKALTHCTRELAPPTVERDDPRLG